LSVHSFYTPRIESQRLLEARFTGGKLALAKLPGVRGSRSQVGNPELEMAFRRVAALQRIAVQFADGRFEVVLFQQ
jgi:hypothetical protein